MYQLTSNKTMTSTFVLAGVEINQDSEGRFSLNDFHRAAGGEDRHSPNRWTRTEECAGLVGELTPELASAPVKTKRGGKSPGTYVCKELVYAYAQWISPKFHLHVIRTFDSIATGHAVVPIHPQEAPVAALVDLAKLTFEHLPNLGESSKQALLSAVTEKALGHKVIPLPKVEEHLMSATEVGEKLGISANMVGRLANAHGLKVTEFGEFRLDKSRHSSKQVESFFYNHAGIERLQKIMRDK